MHACTHAHVVVCVHLYMYLACSACTRARVHVSSVHTSIYVCHTSIYVCHTSIYVWMQYYVNKCKNIFNNICTCKSCLYRDRDRDRAQDSPLANLAQAHVEHEIDTKSTAIAMRVMSLCHQVIVLDTYTWWSAYLSHGSRTGARVLVDATHDTGFGSHQISQENSSAGVTHVMFDHWTEEDGLRFDASSLKMPSWDSVNV